MRRMILLFSSMILFSCGSFPQRDVYTTANTPLELGVLGERKKAIRKTSFSTFMIPVYKGKQKLRLKVSKKQFTKPVFKSYTKFLDNREISHIIQYVDSVKPKPFFFDINIEDKSLVVDVLNKGERSDFNYLLRSPKAKIVSAIRFVVNTEIENKIDNSDAIYLQTDRHKKQWLILYKEGEEFYRVDFNYLNVFGYKLSSVCWELTNKRKFKIGVLIDENESCEYPMKKNSKSLEKQLINNKWF